MAIINARVKVIITDDAYNIEPLINEAVENLENDDYIFDSVDIKPHPIMKNQNYGHYLHQYIIIITYHHATH